MRVPYCRERLLYCGHRPFFCRDDLVRKAFGSRSSEVDRPSNSAQPTNAGVKDPGHCCRKLVSKFSALGPTPCIPFSSSPRVHDIADFLAFAQHVQWTKSHFSAFTSDYQGAGNLLTDPQITSNPFVSISKLKFITLMYSTENLGPIYLETATCQGLSSTSARVIPAIVSAGSLA